MTLIYLSKETNVLDFLSLLFTAITTIFVVYLTLLALKHTAKPRIKVIFNNSRTKYSTESEYLLTFSLSNAGNWYGEPAVKELMCYINVLPPVELYDIKYGATQELFNNQVKEGKGGSKYLKAHGIYLLYGEPGEKILARIKTPLQKGKYKFWISCCSEDGVSQKFNFNILVE
jgi:hypothetical protein